MLPGRKNEKNDLLMPGTAFLPKGLYACTRGDNQPGISHPLSIIITTTINAGA